ncbi:MAG: hypothetical protein A3C71_01555 [Candidatus Yanofskybacteria bacterium RIFCSPHIGHO2_02_FULL_43_15c]|uniref:Uncharacterized protein n=1 Tax=Candidatus Yanofskybacteria bacterium RIFCSPHIGHO2_02_FULL_43_15c TaxID=1802679 RepID=A0A1F8FJN8_9BACT|nr:MAG: hypothetical protein A3C71_01555 [Candidatus Yanofskybacteria bacterium RIFCSPHIGHO2_02_FULL_43_15c]
MVNESSATASLHSVAGLQCGLGFAKLFSGDLDLAKPRLISRPQGLGRNARGLPVISLANGTT